LHGTGSAQARPRLWPNQHSSPKVAYGFARQCQHIFVAEELTAGPHDRNHEEADMEIVRLPITHFEENFRTGEILDVCTIAAWGTYQLWLKSNR
jgi:ADP-ribose pyrophosphatase